MTLYYIYKGDFEPVPVDGALDQRWLDLVEDYALRVVERNRLSHHGSTIIVSTVFLCIDHGFSRSNQPVLFETMVFGGEEQDDDLSIMGTQCRYRDVRAARLGHFEILEKLIQAFSGTEQDLPQITDDLVRSVLSGIRKLKLRK